VMAKPSLGRRANGRAPSPRGGGCGFSLARPGAL